MPDTRSSIDKLLDENMAWDVPTVLLHASFLERAGVSLSIRREDLNHPYLSGNKAHKLKYNLIEAGKLGNDTILTFGGAYSNHILATAAAGKIIGLKTIGIIRGEKHSPLNPTLQRAVGFGMQIKYMDRSTYRTKHSPEVLDRLNDEHGECLVIPEGGSNDLAVKGCREWGKAIGNGYDWVVTACGTGGSMAGLSLGLPHSTKLLGIPVLKGAGFLEDEISNLNQGHSACEWLLNLDYHFGGYAKKDDVLEAFMQDFRTAHQIPLEFVYTGKMMFGLIDLIKRGFFKKGQKILAIHTGGIRN